MVLLGGCVAEEGDPARPPAPDLAAAEMISQRSIPGPGDATDHEIVVSDQGRKWTLTLGASEEDDEAFRRLASGDVAYTETTVLSAGTAVHELRSGSTTWTGAESLGDWFEAANQVTERFGVSPDGDPGLVAYSWWCTEAVRIGCFGLEQWLHYVSCFGICGPAILLSPAAMGVCIGACTIAADLAMTGRQSIGDQCFAKANSQYCSGSGGGGGSGTGTGGTGDGGCQSDWNCAVGETCSSGRCAPVGDS